MKTLLILALLTILFASGFSGCGEATATPSVSEVLLELENAQPTQTGEPVENVQNAWTAEVGYISELGRSATIMETVQKGSGTTWYQWENLGILIIRGGQVYAHLYNKDSAELFAELLEGVQVDDKLMWAAVDQMAGYITANGWDDSQLIKVIGDKSNQPGGISWLQVEGGHFYHPLRFEQAAEGFWTATCQEIRFEDLTAAMACALQP